MSGQERVTRGDLPHWYMPGYAHFITYRLANTIPAAKLREWREQREELKRRGPAGDTGRAHRERLHKQFFAEYDRYLDAHPGPNWLCDSRVADVIRENLYHHNGSKFELLAWCVMSNHVHVVLQPFESAIVGQAASLPGTEHTGVAGLTSSEAGSFGHDDGIHSDEMPDARSPLSSIMHSLKSYTANRANLILGRTGQFWQHESYDHWIRDIEELERIVAYVIRNPVAAGLCRNSYDWKFSSAHDRYRRDGSDCGLVGRLRDDWRR